MAQRIPAFDNQFMRCYAEKYMVPKENQTHFEAIEQTLTGMTQVYEVLGEYIKVLATTVGVLYNQNAVLKEKQKGSSSKILIESEGPSKGRQPQEELEWMIDKAPHLKNDLEGVDVVEVDLEDGNNNPANNGKRVDVGKGVSKVEGIKAQVIGHVGESKAFREREANGKKQSKDEQERQGLGPIPENFLEVFQEENTKEDNKETQKGAGRVHEKSTAETNGAFIVQPVSQMQPQSDGIEDDETSGECEIIKKPFGQVKTSKGKLNSGKAKETLPKNQNVIQITQINAKEMPNRLTKDSFLKSSNDGFQIERIDQSHQAPKAKMGFLSNLGQRNSSELQLDAASLEKDVSSKRIQDFLAIGSHQYNPESVLSQRNKVPLSQDHIKSPKRPLDASAIFLESSAASAHERPNDTSFLSQNPRERKSLLQGVHYISQTKENNTGVAAENELPDFESLEPIPNSESLQSLIQKKMTWKKGFKKQDKKVNTGEEKSPALSQRWSASQNGQTWPENKNQMTIYKNKPESPSANMNEDPNFMLEIPKNIEKMPELPPSDHM